MSSHSRFTIKPPCTNGDYGAPSPHVLKDAKRVFEFIEDERHLTAQTLLHDIQRRIKEADKSISAEKSKRHLGRRKGIVAANGVERKELEEVKALLHSKKDVITKLEVRLDDKSPACSD